MQGGQEVEVKPETQACKIRPGALQHCISSACQAVLHALRLRSNQPALPGPGTSQQTSTRHEGNQRLARYRHMHHLNSQSQQHLLYAVQPVPSQGLTWAWKPGLPWQTSTRQEKA